MKKLLLLLLFVPLVSFGQIDYFVSAKGGLNVREGPDAKAKKLSTLPYGTFVSIESRTAIKLTINDTELTFTNIFGLEDEVKKKIEGEWVKIVSENSISGYVFDGYLEKISISLDKKSITSEVFNEFTSYGQLTFKQVLKGNVKAIKEYVEVEYGHPYKYAYLMDVDRFKRTYKYYFNKENKIYKGLLFFGENKEASIVYAFDSSGNIDSYFWNKKEMILGSYYEDEGGGIVPYSETFYNGNSITTYVYKGDGSYTFEYKWQSKYDYKGNRIELINYGMGNKIELTNYGMNEKVANDKTIYKYDSMGNMIESNKEINDIEYRCLEKSNGACQDSVLIYKGVKENIFKEYEIIKANKIKYEYDDNKNWIKQISYLDDKRLKVITRKIEYYN